MRDKLSVPFTFAMLNLDGTRPHRVHAAAVALQDAANNLVHWSHPPEVSEQGREMFYAYAQALEGHVELLVTGDSTPAYQLGRIRETCNDCHRFFRPAFRFSDDVMFDLFAIDEGQR